jgi:diamine N-acetyltransferase
LNTGEKSLEELVRELPPELHRHVREGIEVLLTHYARREEKPETPDPGPEAEVTLREITAETVRTICNLSNTLAPPRKYMVAPNAVSIAQAYFEPKAWFRAVYADEVPVGFVMLYDDAGSPDEQDNSTDEQEEGKAEYFLWRFMIAGPHHGKGFGRRAIELLVEYVKTRPDAKVLLTSCGQGPGSPEGFYRKLDFERTGEMYGEEVGLSLEL